MSDVQTLKRMIDDFRALPFGQSRLVLNQQALALAEELDIPFYRLYVRAELVWSYMMGDDPAKVLPLCAEFFALLEEYPDGMPPDYLFRNAISMAMISFVVVLDLPQIPLEQCQAMMEQFHDQVKRYGKGERLYHMHVCCFCVATGDLEGAEAHLKAFLESPKDEISDGKITDTCNAAEILLGLGRREEALQMLKPVIALTCDQQPYHALSALINDALDHGELDKAKELGQYLSRHTMSGRKDLPYTGALLRLWAYTNPGRFIHLLEKGISWSIGVWDQSRLFDFYRGAGEFCVRLGEQTDTIPLNLPDSFPLYQENGIYNSSELAQWFYDQAEAIAHSFDQRNRSNYYGRKLVLARISGA